MTPVDLVDATISMDDPNRPRIMAAAETAITGAA